MKKIITLMMLVVGLAVSGWAVPSQITYQGTLKEKGVPANGTKNMKFEILNGNQSIWTYQKAVTVTNGLFSVILSPTGVDWEHITPSLQITIENQLLSPSEPITANVYSLVANAVVDGVITVQKLAPAVQDKLIPSGMISMFATACPTGWTRFTALDNVFPLGGATYGGTGGSSTNTHNHTISSDGSHSHELAQIGTVGYSGPISIGTDDGLGGGQQLMAAGTGGGNQLKTRSKLTTTQGSHNHGGVVGDATLSIMPPYLTVVWCQKQ